jgi:hypothetical protein
MPVVISPDGQPVLALSQDMVADFLRKGYRLPAPEPVSPVVLPPAKPVIPDPAVAVLRPEPVPEPPEPMEPVGDALDLTKATLSQLVALEDVGTARAKKVRALAQAGTLNMNTLQSDVPEVDWVSLYQSGLVTFPGGLSVVPQE